MVTASLNSLRIFDIMSKTSYHFPGSMDALNVLADFHPLVRRWFERTYGTPSPPQQLGWPMYCRRSKHAYSRPDRIG